MTALEMYVWLGFWLGVIMAGIGGAGLWITRDR
jgi:hypothetical protein